MQGAILTFSALTAILAVVSLLKCKKKQFFSDVPFAWLLGVYVWGDGLVLFPFWTLLGLLFAFFTPDTVWLYRTSILFFTVRSFFEVVYWLQKQSMGSTFKPVLLRTISWLNAESTQIIFQLLHSCIVVVGVLLLLCSFLSW